MNAEDLSRVAVVGAGTMGAGIAGLLARAGCTVQLVDATEEALDRGMDMMRLGQEALVDAGLCSAKLAEESLQQIHTTTRLELACEGAEIVIEAISEDLDAKRVLYGRMDVMCPEEVVFATNTSGLSITKIAAATKRPDRVVGMHFWNPPHIIPLVEVTRGEETSEATAELLMAICRRLGKKPILVRHDLPGFVGNRLQFAVMREALHLLAEGVASAEDIDTAMTAGPGLRYSLLGPLQTADLGGLDVFHAISSYLFAALNSSPEPSPALAERVKEGKLGAKSGEGLYSYSKADLKQLLERRDRVLLQFLDILAKEEGA